MKCELCHRNDAKVAIHVASGGKERELYVCRDCAEKEKGRRRPPRRKFGRQPFEEEDDEGDVMGRPHWTPESDVEDEEENARRHWTLAEDVAPCPDCGSTVEDFDHSGLLGCPYCYTAFKEILARNVRMRGIFGGEVPNRHEGGRRDADAGGAAEGQGASPEG